MVCTLYVLFNYELIKINCVNYHFKLCILLIFHGHDNSTNEHLTKTHIPKQILPF